MENKIQVEILPNKFLLEDGKFDKKSALNFCGKIAGICYSQSGFEVLKNEDEKKTNGRIDRTINNGHHSVYDHVMINLNIKKLPKILAMVLNNEHQYTTSEKSARYTKVEESDEIDLYNKWVEIYKEKITARYGDVFNDKKSEKLAMENARYLVSVFMTTEMVYSTTLRQINYIVSWMREYIENANRDSDFEVKLSKAMKEFIDCLEELNLLEDGLLKNEKKRSISLFGKNIKERREIFSDVYSINYEASFAYFAQAQRHRTLDYEIALMDDKKYFVPPIIENDEELVKEWLEDISKVKYPQGELILINERGTYENFILKCKERLCSAAQLEIANKTQEILENYEKALKEDNHPLKDDIILYNKGARCTFPGYECTEKCLFKEGIKLIRKI